MATMFTAQWIANQAALYLGNRLQGMKLIPHGSEIIGQKCEWWRPVAFFSHKRVNEERAPFDVVIQQFCEAIIARSPIGFAIPETHAYEYYAITKSNRCGIAVCVEEVDEDDPIMDLMFSAYVLCPVKKAITRKAKPVRKGRLCRKVR